MGCDSWTPPGRGVKLPILEYLGWGDPAPSQDLPTDSWLKGHGPTLPADVGV